MAFSDYSALKTEIEKLMQRSDSKFTDRHDSFTQLTEAYINTELELRGQEASATTTYDSSATNRSLSLPTGFKEIFSLWIKASSEADHLYRKLGYVQPEEMWRYLLEDGNEPTAYTFRDVIYLNALPDEEWTVRIYYLKGWDLVTNSTNNVLTDYPDIYLYGNLYHAHLFVYGEDQNNPNIERYLSLFKDAVHRANLQHHRSTDDEQLETPELAALGYYDGEVEYDILRGGYR